MYVQCIPNIFDHLATEGPIKSKGLEKIEKLTMGEGMSIKHLLVVGARGKGCP